LLIFRNNQLCAAHFFYFCPDSDFLVKPSLHYQLKVSGHVSRNAVQMAEAALAG